MSRPSAFIGQSSIGEEEIQLVERIGKGCFGTVYRGMCRAQEVAVKVPKKQKLTRKAYEAFRKEVSHCFSNLYNPYVCLFMGACLVPGKIRIVTELMKGDLESLLRSDKEIKLSVRMGFAKDAALGMAWLHGCNPPVIHRDLKVANMLYDENMRIKVCDFGLSEFQIEEEMFEKEPKGTPLYMAPEVMRKEAITPKVDVYAFGIILWELLTRKEAFSHHGSYDTFMRSVCDENERPEIPPDCPPRLRELMHECWMHEPTFRPNFSDIIPKLTDVISECSRLEHLQVISENISEPSARQFWAAHFLEDMEVEVHRFIDVLYAHFNLEVPTDPTKQPLPSEASEQDIQKASKYQLSELSSRGSHFATLAEEELLRRRARAQEGAPLPNPLYGYGYMVEQDSSAPDERLRQVLCLQSLLGEEEEQVTISRFGIVSAVFAPFNVESFERIIDMMQEPWFHGFMTTREVEHLLKNKDRGTYLIRFSNSHRNSFVISKVSNKQVIKHVVVPFDPKKGFKLDGYFPSLPELIRKHMKTFRLDHPCPGSKYSYLFDDVSNEIGGYGTY